MHPALALPTNDCVSAAPTRLLHHFSEVKALTDARDDGWQAMGDSRALLLRVLRSVRSVQSTGRQACIARAATAVAHHQPSQGCHQHEGGSATRHATCEGLRQKGSKSILLVRPKTVQSAFISEGSSDGL